MQKIKNQVIQGKLKPIVMDTFFKKNEQQKPIVIFCHGYKGFKDWGAWDLMAEKFAENNFFFLKFNFSHNGGTVEQPIDFPDLEAFGHNNYTKELDDLETVINWISENKDFTKEAAIQKISLIGHSRAGGIVTIKAEEDTRIKKVITLAAVSNYGKRSSTIGDLETWRKTGVKYVLNGRTQQQMPHYFQFFEDFKKNETRLTIQRAVENLKIPFLIIHGTKDTAILINEAHDLHAWNAESTLEIIEDANHVFGASHPWEKENLPIHLEKVANICIDFLKI